MTHNQVSYWNAKLDRALDRQIRSEQNRIAKQNADTNKFAAEREEYWTHRQYNQENSKFGYTIFKDLTSMLGMAMLF